MKLLALVVSTIFFTSSVFANAGHDETHFHLIFKGGAIHIHAGFEAVPKVNEEAKLILDVKDAATHKNAEIADKIEVSLWMPMQGGGHGSAPTQVQQVLDEKGNLVVGRFLVSDIYFVMGGKWEVRVKLTDAQGNAETQTFEIKIDGGHGHGHFQFLNLKTEEDRIVYGCHPLEPSFDNPVEGAIVRIQNGQLVLAYYLTSQTWGAVDEFIESPTVSQTNESYLAVSENASLEIDLKESSQLMVGEHPATLKLKSTGESTDMYCLAGEF